MKPIKIVIEGINSFTDPQTLDFETVGRTNLFCISGKTGAGKTTIFDSIMLALYGGCGRGNLADLINLSRKKARVILDFTEGGDLYTVDRTLSRKNSDSQSANTECVLYKNGAPFAKGTTEINKVIREIIGLGESEFKNVYLLEQGEYADFLKKSAGEQMAAVGKIFALMRFDDVCRRARERKKTEDAEVDAHGKLVEAYGDVTESSVRDEKTALATLKAKTTALKKTEEAGRAELVELNRIRDLYNEVRTKQDNVKNLMLQADGARIKLAESTRLLDEFEAGQDKTLPDKLNELREKHGELVALNARDKACAAAESDAQNKRAAADKQKANVAETERKISELAERKRADESAVVASIRSFEACIATADRRSRVLTDALQIVTTSEDVVALAGAARDVETERDKYVELCKQVGSKSDELNIAREDCGKKLRVIEMYTTELKSLETAMSDAEKQRDAAQKALEAARLDSHAQAVRAELHAGDVCPVCGGVYNGGEHCENTDVERCKAGCDTAAERLAAATENVAACGKSLDRAKTDYEHAEEKRTTCEREKAELERRASEMHVDVDIYNELIDKLNSVQAARRKSAASQADCEKYTAEYNVVRERLAAAEAAAAESEQKASEYKSELGEHYGKTAVMLAALKTELATLESKIAAVETKRKEFALAVSGAKAAVETVEQSLDRAKADCPVDLPAFDEDTYNSRTAQNEQLLAQIAANEVDIARREVEIGIHEQSLASITKAAAERDLHLKNSKLYSEIIEITKNKAMLNFVAAEYIEDFTAVAGDILSELTGGKYIMGYDKESGFFVTDYLNDGKLRKTDTLSGGELFLASLSVAIAIARTQAGGNNAFFFLDEGFGTLDDDLIDTVYGALEALSRDCLVGVISHSGALIEKMPSCVEIIEASDTVGSLIKY